MFQQLAFFMQKPFKEGIKTLIEQMNWPKGAISNKDRSSELLNLENELFSLENEMEKLKTNATQAGILLDY